MQYIVTGPVWLVCSFGREWRARSILGFPKQVENLEEEKGKPAPRPGGRTSSCASGPSQRTIAPSSARVLQDFRVAEVGGESWVPPQQVARLASNVMWTRAPPPPAPSARTTASRAPRQHSRKEADGIASPKVQLSERKLPACDEAVVVAGREETGRGACRARPWHAVKPTS